METSDHPEESEETSSALSKTNQQSSWSIYQDHMVNLLQTKENLAFEEAYSLSKSNNFWPKFRYNFENLLEMFLKKIILKTMHLLESNCGIWLIVRGRNMSSMDPFHGL